MAEPTANACSLPSVGTIPIGVVRFDAIGRRAVRVSLYLDPALTASDSAARCSPPASGGSRARGRELECIEARSCPDNDRSRRLFARAGFSRAGDDAPQATSIQPRRGSRQAPRTPARPHDDHALQIGERPIGARVRPYLIAEMSGNHNQSLDRALAIVDAAADSGADAVKLQTYTADTMTLDLRTPGFVIDDPDSLWAGRQLYELYEEAHTPWDWHAPIMERARERGLHCFSTPFDDTAVDFLEVARCARPTRSRRSRCTDLPLIRKVAATGKPMIISTGMATARGDRRGRAAPPATAGCRQLVLLKCTSTYPATPENTNLRTIPNLRETFGCEVGLSDHTMGCGVAVAAVALGATVIEKHFTLRRADGGVDSAFSLEPAEFAQLRTESERAWQSLGEVPYGGTAAEEKSRAFRRTLYISQALPEGAHAEPREPAHRAARLRPGPEVSSTSCSARSSRATSPPARRSAGTSSHECACATRLAACPRLLPSVPGRGLPTERCAVARPIRIRLPHRWRAARSDGHASAVL